MLTKNINGIVHNLGFLSTSLSKMVASEFAWNVLFEIEVHDFEREEDLDFGYAFIKEYSIQSRE